jgi:hypothetical protein
VVFTAHFVAYRASLAARLAESGGGGGIQSEEEEMNGNNSNGSAEQEVLPPANDGLAWRAFVDGTPPPPADEEEAMNSAAEPECPPREPLLRILQRLDTVRSLPSPSPVPPLMTIPLTTQFTTLAIHGHLTPTTTHPAHRARWLFALLATLEPHLGSDEMSTLRAFARDVIAFVRERYTAAIYAGELVHVPVRPGFYAGDESDPPQLPAPGVSLERQGWTLGAKCKLKRDALPRSEPARPDGVTGLTPVVDDEISRAWVVILAVIAGWAQRDLVDEYERSLGRLPLP